MYIVQKMSYLKLNSNFHCTSESNTTVFTMYIVQWTMYNEQCANLFEQLFISKSTHWSISQCTHLINSVFWNLLKFICIAKKNIKTVIDIYIKRLQRRPDLLNYLTTDSYTSNSLTAAVPFIGPIRKWTETEFNQKN